MMMNTRSAYWCQIAVLIAVFHLLGPVSAFDCRIFPFHPTCRGHMGKRSIVPTLHQDQEANVLVKELEFWRKEPLSDVEQDLDPFQLICRRFVFAPLCRGVTSKRSPPEHLPSLGIADEPAVIHKNQGISQDRDQLLRPQAAKSDGALKPQVNQINWSTPPVDPVDGNMLEGDLALRSRRNVLDTFASFYMPKKLSPSYFRNRRNVLDSFASFVNYPALKPKNPKKNALDSFASFYHPTKRNVLDSFSSFYAALKNGQLESDQGNKRSHQADPFKDILWAHSNGRQFELGEEPDNWSSWYLPEGGSERQEGSAEIQDKPPRILNAFLPHFGPDSKKM